MTATGITRRIDDLGRIVLPSEIRNNMGIKATDMIEFFVEGRQVIMQKYTQGCILTGEMDDLVEYGGQKFSKHAVKELAKVAGL